MFDYERAELEAEFFAEDPGAVAARLHNEQEGYWASLEDEECSHCGGLGYTIEINDEGVEYMDACFDCFVAAHEKEAA